MEDAEKVMRCQPKERAAKHERIVKQAARYFWLRGQVNPVPPFAEPAKGGHPRIYEMSSLTVGSRLPSILRIGQCEIEAKDLLLLAVAEASTRHRFRGCGRRWRLRAL